MARTFWRQMLAVTLIVMSVFVSFGQGYAAPTLKLTINPNQGEFPVGHAPISLTTRASGVSLEYTWTLNGPGKIEGTGPAVVYNVPTSIQGKRQNVTITVTVKDDSGDEATESVSFAILQAAGESGETPKEDKPGMSRGKKIGLGLGAAALLGGGIALAAGGGDDDGDSSSETVDFNGPWTFSGQLTNNSCDLNVVSSISGDITFYQAGTTIKTSQINLNVIPGGGYWYFTYSGTASGNTVSLAATNPYVLTGSGSVYHFGSGIDIQNIKNNVGAGSINLTGSCIQGCSGSCQTIWSGNWTKAL